jgi:hypothetical protein
MEEVIPQSGVKRSSSSILPALRNTGGETKKGEGWPITFRHLGKNGYELTLYASNQLGRQKLLEAIDNVQQRLRARADFLNTTVITSGFFSGTNKVNCVAPFGKFIGLVVGETLLTLIQTVVASSFTEPTTASTCRIADLRITQHPNVSLTCQA